MSIQAARLRNQRLVGAPFETPEDAVRHFGAVQSQDYGGAKWALAQRLPAGVREADLDRAFDEGRLLRTHVMRPTWHFVLPEDIRWLQALTAHRVTRVMAGAFRQQELDPVLARAEDAMTKALEGGRHLTRPELGSALQAAGIATDGLRLTFLIMRAELDALICSGPRRGRQFTYALLDERAPQARVWPREEALAELVRRYFASHGPAQPKDFAWWSGLTVADARAGIALLGDRLPTAEVDGPATWATPVVHLLPNYDEYTVGYRDRSAIRGSFQPDDRSGDMGYVVAVDGILRAGWRRTQARGEVVIEVRPQGPFTDDELAGLQAAGARYGRFAGMPVRLLV